MSRAPFLRSGRMRQSRLLMGHQDRRESAEHDRLAEIFSPRIRFRMRRQSCSAVSRRPGICGLDDPFQSSVESAAERKRRLEHRWLRPLPKCLALCNECWLPRLIRKRPRRRPLGDVFVFRRLTRRECNRSSAFVLHQSSFGTPRQFRQVRAQPISSLKSKLKKLSELRPKGPALGLASLRPRQDFRLTIRRQRQLATTAHNDARLKQGREQRKRELLAQSMQFARLIG